MSVTTSFASITTRARWRRCRPGKVPIYEPGLEEVIHRNVSAKRLRFTGSIKEGVDNSQIIFIAVPTPQHARRQR